MFLIRKLADELVEEANLTMGRLHEWTCQDRAQINTNKTNAIIFHKTNEHVIIHLHTSLNLTPIDILPSIKTLGVTLQENFSCDMQVNSLAKKLFQTNGLVYRNRHTPPRKKYRC